MRIRAFSRCGALLSGVLLAACGGGGNGPSLPITAVAGFATLPSSSYANRCAPDNPDAEADARTGSRITEMAWVRAMLKERYLWNDDLPVLNPRDPRYQGRPGDPVDHETALQRWFTDHVRPGGDTRRDAFSYRLRSAAAEVSLAGQEAGWGLSVAAASADPARLYVTWVDPDGPAAQAGLRRGDELLSVDDVAVASADPDARQQIDIHLAGAAPGSASVFTVGRSDGPLTRRLVAASFERQPVPLVSVLGTESGLNEPVGYLLFNAFNEPAQWALKQALAQLAAARVSDLIIDLRYNGGGLGFIASQLAFMVAGSSSQGKTFNQSRMNPERTASQPDDAMPFLTRTCSDGDERCERGEPLPALGLKRVYVLTGSETCSASELLINGLRGIDIEVVQIGGGTCGKPYGFEGVPNCGASTFAIDVQATNAKGFGDYAGGFQPGGTGPTGLPGCEVPDDLGHALGDRSEALLAAALNHRATGQCPIQTTGRGVLARPQVDLRQYRAAPLDLLLPGGARHPAVSAPTL